MSSKRCFFVIILCGQLWCSFAVGDLLSNVELLKQRPQIFAFDMAIIAKRANNKPAVDNELIGGEILRNDVEFGTSRGISHGEPCGRAFNSGGGSKGRLRQS